MKTTLDTLRQTDASAEDLIWFEANWHNPNWPAKLAAGEPVKFLWAAGRGFDECQDPRLILACVARGATAGWLTADKIEKLREGVR